MTYIEITMFCANGDEVLYFIPTPKTWTMPDDVEINEAAAA